MCPSHWFHNMVESILHDRISLVLGSTTWLQLSSLVFPNNFYRVPILIPHINTIVPHTILHVSFSKTVRTPAFSIVLPKIRFLAKPGICNTHGSIPLLPLFNISQTFPHPMIIFSKSSPNKTSPLFSSSYSQNQCLWGVIWNDAPELINHDSLSICVLIEDKYTLPFSSSINLPSVDYDTSKFLLVPTPFDLQSFL